LTADLEELSEGTYTVEWRVISADTHPVDGTYEFVVTGAGGDEPQSALQTNAERVGESGKQPPDRAEPGSVEQQDTGGILPHLGHILALGLGAVIVLALALLRRTK
jgi:hypothetical protein